MGYVEIIDGSGFTGRIENDQVLIEPSLMRCDCCNDDRLLREGDLFKCYNCHTINRIPYHA